MVKIKGKACFILNLIFHSCWYCFHGISKEMLGILLILLITCLLNGCIARLWNHHIRLVCTFILAMSYPTVQKVKRWHLCTTINTNDTIKEIHYYPDHMMHKKCLLKNNLACIYLTIFHVVLFFSNGQGRDNE